MTDQTSDDVKSRMARRFEGERDENDETEQHEKRDKNAKKGGSEKNDERAKNEERKKTEKTANVKSAWTNHSVYLDDELADDLGRRFKKLDWELSDQHGFDIQKTRHYYPLVVALGLEQLDELDSKDVKERIERLS